MCSRAARQHVKQAEEGNAIMQSELLLPTGVPACTVLPCPVRKFPSAPTSQHSTHSPPLAAALAHRAVLWQSKGTAIPLHLSERGFCLIKHENYSLCDLI